MIIGGSLPSSALIIDQTANIWPALRRLDEGGWAAFPPESHVTSPGGRRSIYNQYSYEAEKAEAVERVARLIESIVEPSPASNVIPIRADLG